MVVPLPLGPAIKYSIVNQKIKQKTAEKSAVNFGFYVQLDLILATTYSSVA